MRFVFVRHGHYLKPLEEKEKKQAPLTPHGAEAARGAGEFLRASGIVPDLVLTTETRRTKATAEILLQVLGLSLPIYAKPSGFRYTMTDFESKLEAWIAESGLTPQTVLFVGHNNQQAVMQKVAGVPLPRENRAAVIVLDRLGSGWTCVCSHAGLS